jgi:hypothetical protein
MMFSRFRTLNSSDRINYQRLLVIAAVGIGLLLYWPSNASTAQNPHHKKRSEQYPAIEEIIRFAGNAEDDKIRYRLLIELQKRPGLSAQLQKELKTLLPAIDDWANGYERAVQGALNNKPRIRYLHWGFHKRIGLNNDYPGSIPRSSALYPIWCLYRSRYLIWFQIERDDSKSRGAWYDEARSLLKVARQAFPENRIIGMYLGEPIPWSAGFQADPNAPLWANLQREGLEKVREVIHWWIDHRQLPDGQYGGDWGDDVEMWRWWTPILIGFDDPKIFDAQMKLSMGRLTQPELKNGYTSVMNDVEHGAEETADALLPAMHLAPEHPELKKWALRLAELMRTRWTGLNRRGFLQYKSAYFNVFKVDALPVHACDTVYHPRAVEPALLYWLRTGDEELGKLFSAWMDTWVDAAAKEDRGKPAGIIPSAIHWPDGRVGGLSDPWWQPKIYDYDLYSWPSGMAYMNKALMLTCFMTGNEKYLEPLLSMMRIRLEYHFNPPQQEPLPGSAAWCALAAGEDSDGMSSFLPETVAKLRLLTSIDRIDDILAKSRISGYLKMRISGDQEYLTQDLSKSMEAWRINRPAFTSEVRYTDRVLNFTDRWYNHGNGWSYPTPNVALLYSMITGDPGSHTIFPLYAVRWQTQPREIAVLVTDSGRNRLNAELYHFGESDRDMGAIFYILKPGHYRMVITGSKGQQLADEAFTVEKRTAEVPFKLPARQLCRLQVTAVAP